MMLAATNWTEWSAVGSLAAAVATLILAIVTLGLVFVTKRMVNAAKKGLDDEWSREWAAQRPVVYPLSSEEWAHGLRPRKLILPLKNGGRGPALNVEGVIAAVSNGKSYERAIVAGTIAAGDLFEARIERPGIHDWSGATGVISYSDLAGGHYEGRFECSLGPGKELVVTVHDPAHVVVVTSPGSLDG